MEPTLSNFFSDHSGSSAKLESKPGIYWSAIDALHDLGLQASGRLRRLRRQAAKAAPRKVLIVGIEVPSRAPDIHRVVASLGRSRHLLSTSIVPMGDSGKFDNINHALDKSEPLSEFDWLVVTDDDISFSARFLDDLILLAEASGLSLLQPAHAFRSHTSYAVTKRRWASLVRQTNFVEIGPLTLIKADVFGLLIPFPNTRWCYGIDLVWSEVLRRDGRGLGIVDGTPVRHLRPVGMSYDMNVAIDEGKCLLQQFDVQTSRQDFLGNDRIVIATH